MKIILSNIETLLALDTGETVILESTDTLSQLVDELFIYADSHRPKTAAEKTIDYIVQTADDETLIDLADIFPLWKNKQHYKTGNIVRFSADIYKVLQDHKSQSDWLPPDVPALYVRIAPPGVIPEWRQPQGEHDAYGLGARVIYDNKIYESKIEANTTIPGSDERWWELIEDLTPGEPVDPENPEEPTDPENPEEPTDPEEPIDPEEPVDPEPEEPAVEPWEDRWSINQTGYITGDIVTHNGFYWISKVGAPGNWNIHEPSDDAYAAWEKGDPVI